MGARSQTQKTYNVPMDFFVDKCRSINASNLNVVLKSENPTETGVWFRVHHGMTMLSWGEKITITITRCENGVTQVQVLSECGMPTQVVDMGKNAQNVRNVFAYLEKGLPSPGTPVNQVASAPAVAPVPAPEPVASEPVRRAVDAPVPNEPEAPKCAACGTELVPGARFCTHCGTPVPTERHCVSCGVKLTSDARFCPMCGTRQ